MRIGFVVHSGRDDCAAAARDVAERLDERDVDVVVARDGPPAGSPQVPAPEVAPEAFADDLDLALSFGGDGTLLRAAYLCRDAGVPVLGLNLGRLGFLTEVERDDLSQVLDAIVAEELLVDERATLQVRAEGAGGELLVEDWALNEVSVEKTARQRLLLMTLHVGGSLFAHVPADAVVVASPTGSTAYAFSAGGPILSPQLDATVVTPVAPHSTFGRSLVVRRDEQVRIEVLGDQEAAVMSCDGRAPVTVPPGGSVYVVGGGDPVRLAHVRPPDFFGRVRAKFGLR